MWDGTGWTRFPVMYVNRLVLCFVLCLVVLTEFQLQHKPVRYVTLCVPLEAAYRMLLVIALSTKLFSLVLEARWRPSSTSTVHQLVICGICSDASFLLA
ncbi:MAG: hypothetical protein ACKERG_04130 [Candidatus Hodgkinia cicadicola]